MFEIVGFLAYLVGLGCASVAWFLWAGNTLGRYNIGGVPNSIGDKFWCILASSILGSFWWKLLSCLSITMSL